MQASEKPLLSTVPGRLYGIVLPLMEDAFSLHVKSGGTYLIAKLNISPDIRWAFFR